MTGITRRCAENSLSSNVIPPAEDQCQWKAENDRYPNIANSIFRDIESGKGFAGDLNSHPATNYIESRDTQYVRRRNAMKSSVIQLTRPPGAEE